MVSTGAKLHALKAVCSLLVARSTEALKVFNACILSQNRTAVMRSRELCWPTVFEQTIASIGGYLLA